MSSGTVGVVWAKWAKWSEARPALWIDLADVSTKRAKEELLRCRSRSSGADQVVQFFGGGEYAWCQLDDLEQFESGSARKLSTAAGIKAVALAESYLAELQNFEDDTVVWGKYLTYPWWPSLIVTPQSPQ